MGLAEGAGGGLGPGAEGAAEGGGGGEAAGEGDVGDAGAGVPKHGDGFLKAEVVEIGAEAESKGGAKTSAEAAFAKVHSGG